VTSDPDFKVTTSLEIKYRKNGASYGQIVHKKKLYPITEWHYVSHFGDLD